MGVWERREDAKNLGLIAVSGMVGALVTGALLIPRQATHHRDHREYRYAHEVRDTRRDIVAYHFEPTAPITHDGPIYGRVRTVDGQDFTGFIRWDRNEDGWTDVLDAAKVTPNGGQNLSGVRFGQIRGIQVQGPHAALLTLRSGHRVEMEGFTSDLGAGVRGIVVTGADHARHRLEWEQVDMVEFMSAPAAARPAAPRLYGTLTTRSGQTFTGFVAWNMEDVAASDFLNGYGYGRRQFVPFATIERIVREGPSGARVILRSGEKLTLTDAPDVSRRNEGITVSDPGLGQVRVRWSDFDNVTFSDPPARGEVVDFDGGRPLSGTVVTESGQELTGTVRWDNDEAYTWEMLNGSAGGADMEVELSRIATIAKAGRGATVTLRDGRTFQLTGSNDVNARNRGIFVDAGGEVHEVTWHDFKELRLGG